jgi:hypothetical protein
MLCGMLWSSFTKWIVTSAPVVTVRVPGEKLKLVAWTAKAAVPPPEDCGTGVGSALAGDVGADVGLVVGLGSGSTVSVGAAVGVGTAVSVGADVAEATGASVTAGRIIVELA